VWFFGCRGPPSWPAPLGGGPGRGCWAGSARGRTAGEGGGAGGGCRLTTIGTEQEERQRPAVGGQLYGRELCLVGKRRGTGKTACVGGPAATACLGCFHARLFLPVSAGPGRFCVAADGPGRRRAGASRCPLACQSRGRCGRGVRAARVTLVRRAGGDTRAGGRGRGRLVAAQQPWRSGDDDWHTVPLAPPGLVAGRPAEVGGPAWPPAGAACRACWGASACPVGRRQRRRPPSCRWASGSSSRRRRRGRSCHCSCRPTPQGVQSVAALVGAGVPAGGGVPPLVGRPAVALHSSDCNPAQNPRPRSRVARCDLRSCKPTSATAPRGPKRHKSPAQWCLSCVHAQTSFSCKKLRNNLADRPGWGRKRRFRPQQFVQRKCALSGLST